MRINLLHKLILGNQYILKIMGDNRFEELPQKFAFFWKSDDNPEKYIIYDHQNQVLLNILLSKFLNNQN